MALIGSGTDDLTLLVFSSFARESEKEEYDLVAIESVTAAIEYKSSLGQGISRAASTPPFDKLPFLGTGPSYRSMGTSIDSAIGKVRHGITLRSSTRLDRGKLTYSCSSQVESVSFGSRLRFDRERFGTSSISCLAPGWLAYLPYDFRTFFFSVSTHPVTDESVVGISKGLLTRFNFKEDFSRDWCNCLSPTRWIAPIDLAVLLAV
ncbi:hypothetical protein VNO77_46170 [Canavalia gladiata]|uniref:Uncharacterized protein n=1 Tax=Canavalia gladiata TaxID=3824 RepID=A0AAN9JH26_CANGL